MTQTFNPDRDPAYDGPMGIFTDYEGCESGIDTTPLPEDAKAFELEDFKGEPGWPLDLPENKNKEDPERWDGQS